MKIQIVIPLWKRPNVTRFCFDSLLEMVDASKYDYSVLCVISEPYYETVCDAYGFKWVYAENNPLGSKINTGLRVALKEDWDYVMMMNSDNVVKSELIDDYYQSAFDERREFFGINKVTYVNFYTKEAREVTYETSVLGIAKCIRRDVVKKLDGCLYNPLISRCLDDTMLDNMAKVGVLPRIVRYDGMLAMDFKSETNIWPWEKFSNRGKEVVYAAV